jgi:hypothetical protein
MTIDDGGQGMNGCGATHEQLNRNAGKNSGTSALVDP